MAIAADAVSPADRAIIVKHLGHDLDDLDPAKDLRITKVDLNVDGHPDYVTVCTSSMNCGSGGCAAWVLMSDGDRYRNVFPDLLVFGVTVGATRTKGVTDLEATGRDGSSLRLVWDGKAYQLAASAK
jgi:hypothetical protein